MTPLVRGLLLASPLVFAALATAGGADLGQLFGNDAPAFETEASVLVAASATPAPVGADVPTALPRSMLVIGGVLVGAGALSLLGLSRGE